MIKTVLQRSHEEYFLEQGWYFALSFLQGWFVGRVVDKGWANLEPWSLGAVAAGGNLAQYDEIQDANNRHYLEPYTQDLIYHTFWGVTPTPARIKWQYPSRTDQGSMLAIPRTLTDTIGYIDGRKSPYGGPFSEATEIWTIKDQYPTFNVLNPTPDIMSNVMLNLDQRQYTYTVIKDLTLIKELLIGNRRVKKYTMGIAQKPMDIPQWLSTLIGVNLLEETRKIMAGAK